MLTRTMLQGNVCAHLGNTPVLLTVPVWIEILPVQRATARLLFIALRANHQQLLTMVSAHDKMGIILIPVDHLVRHVI